MKKLAILIIFLFFAQGCANYSPTTYQEYAYRGGYSSTQLDDNIFKVVFKGNGYTSREKVEDFALLRSAEIALEHGFQYFAILDEDDYVKTSVHTSEPTYHTTSDGLGGATTTTSGGKTTTVSKPTASNTILLLREKPKTGLTYNANFIFREIRNKYEIDE